LTGFTDSCIGFKPLPLRTGFGLHVGTVQAIVRDFAANPDSVLPLHAHWHTLTGHYPSRLVFDSRATTWANLSELNHRGVGFITIRRRGAAMIRRIRALLA
jgi:hypothetical protein